MSTYLIIVVCVTGAFALGNLLTFSLQYYFLFRPNRLSDDHQHTFSSYFEEVNLNTPGDGRINALWFHEKDKVSEKGVVIYFHGNRGNLTRWGNVYKDQFDEHGVDVFVMDYRGYGKSRGRRSQRLFFEDAKAVYIYVSQYYPPDKVIIYGRSIGSGMASFLASRVDAKKLILETPFASISDLFHSYYPFLPKLFLFKFPFRNKKHLKKVKYPIVVFASGRDGVTPLRSSIPLKRSLKEGDKFILIDEANHGNLALFDEFRESIKEELD